MAVSVNLITWNTCGIRDTNEFPQKRQQILDTLTKLQASVAFLQETHIGAKNISCIKTIPGWKTYYSVHHPCSKGVAVLIQNDLPFEYIKHDVEPTGSYIVLICKLYGKCFTLVNVYNHPKEHKVLQHLSEYLLQTAKGVLIVAGDFNTVLSTDLDREHPTGHKEPLRHYLEQFISSLMLEDVWGLCARDSLENINSFTRFSQKKTKQNGASRLDMIFMPRNALWLVNKCEIKPNDPENLSDHNPVILHLHLDPEQAASSTGQNIVSHIKAGEISEAEVLKAISSLIECENARETLEDIKRNKEQKAGKLKIDFNHMIMLEMIPQDFTKSEEKNGWHFFKAEYMILATILVRRIETFLQPSFKTKNIKNYDNSFTVGFQTTPRTIRKAFLNKALSSLGGIKPSPPRGFKILEKLLPNTESDLELRKGCPLTSTLLTLSLKYLAGVLKTDLQGSVSYFCHHRKRLSIYMNNNETELQEKIGQFEMDSGFSLFCNVREQRSSET